MKSLIKAAAIRAFNTRSAQALTKMIHRNKIIFLGYHGVCRDDDMLEAWTLVRENQFYQQILFIKHNYDCLTIDEALHHPLKNRRQPGVVVTFDDGYANNLEIALPVLEAFNIPAVIYTTTRPVVERELFWPDKIWTAAKCSCLSSIDLRDVAAPLGIYNLNSRDQHWQDNILYLLEDIKRTDHNQRNEIVETIVTRFQTASGTHNFELSPEGNVFSPLTADQLTRLSSHPLITIGSHSHDHAILDQISIAQAIESIRTSKEILEKITGLPINHFAYPNGNYNAALIKIVQDLNFSSAVTFQPGFYNKDDNPFTIKRFGVGSDTSIEHFMVMLTGVFQLKNRLLRTC